MAIQLYAAARSAVLQGLQVYIDALVSVTLKIYSVGNTLLVTMNLTAPTFGTATSGSMAKAGVWSGIAVASDNAYKFNIFAGGIAVVYGSVGYQTGGVDGSEDLILVQEDPTITEGQLVTVSTFTLTTANSL